MELPKRQHPARQPVYGVGTRSQIIFLTVCTHQRKRILANEAVHQILIKAWTDADHWVVGRYVIMPDHLHLFCSPARHNHLSVKAWIRFWKSTASKSWPDASQHPIWQVDGWDTQLRKGDSYSAKWDYVRNNPVRHGLVTESINWPYQGEVQVLHWHD